MHHDYKFTLYTIKWYKLQQYLKKIPLEDWSRYIIGTFMIKIWESQPAQMTFRNFEANSCFAVTSMNLNFVTSQGLKPQIYQPHTEMFCTTQAVVLLVWLTPWFGWTRLILSVRTQSKWLAPEQVLNQLVQHGID